MAAIGKVEIIVTVSTPETRHLAALEEMALAVGHYIRHGGEGAYQDLRGSYIALKETT